MEFKAIVEQVKFNITGGILDCELDDEGFGKVVNSAFREVQRYIDDTKLITIPYKPCIDLTKYSVSAVARVFRAVGYLMNDESTDGTYPADPLYLSQWQLFGGNSSMYNLNNFTYSYGAFNTALQIKNSTSTDLAFRFERYNSKLYVNCPYDKPEKITVEYVPRYNNVEEIVSDYWIDILLRMATALAKITVGRIRTRFTQDNALWKQDGETILNEGTEELNNLREKLEQNSQLLYGID